MLREGFQFSVLIFVFFMAGLGEDRNICEYSFTMITDFGDCEGVGYFMCMFVCLGMNVCVMCSIDHKLKGRSTRKLFRLS